MYLPSPNLGLTPLGTYNQNAPGSDACRESLPECVVSTMSGPPPETAKDRTQTKNTHAIPGQELKFLIPPGIESRPPSWKAGTLSTTPRRRMFKILAVVNTRWIKYERDWFFYERKTASNTLLTLEEEVASLPSLSDSCELVQSCLISTREMSEQKVSVSVEQRIIITFLTEEGVQPLEIFQRLEKNSLEKHVSPELECSNGVKPSERGEGRERASERERERARERVYVCVCVKRERERVRRIIVDREYQSPHTILTELSILISFRNSGPSM